MPSLWRLLLVHFWCEAAFPAVVFHLIVSRLFISELTQKQRWRQWWFHWREAICYYIHDWLARLLFCSFSYGSISQISFQNPAPFFFFLARFGLALCFEVGLGRHTGRKRGSSGGKAKSVYNQTRHLRWPNGRKCSAAIQFSMKEHLFSVHLMYKYTTTDTTVYIHLTMVISVATSLCKIACFHIKSPPILCFLSRTFTFRDDAVSQEQSFKTCVISAELQNVFLQGQWRERLADVVWKFFGRGY